VGQGLDVHAANGRDLWHNNLSAPRIVQPVAGDFAVQAICSRAVADKPSIGGILIWKDQANFLSLLDGLWGQFDIAFRGCANNHDELIGHGRLPAERVWLRMERRGQQVRALCSPDGSTWLAVGQLDFPVEDPVEVGLHAIGWIDRTVYPGAYPDGTAIRFEVFELDEP
jgi:regulation of enolase protein 1 (concanavalin A-like superfamily)